jgi:hypothetical protein
MLDQGNATMNHPLAIRRLWWKEWRQLMPMVIMLPVLTASVLALLALSSLASGTGQWSGISPATVYVLFMVPVLFAIGAGGLLVGQEKETRTLCWLSSLPVSSRDLVRIKLTASLLSLLVIWLFSGTAYMLLSAFDYTVRTEAAECAIWLLYSLYLLLAGFALSWRLKSSLLSLLLVPAAAVIPNLMAHVAEAVRRALVYPPESVHRLDGPGDAVVMACLTLSSAVAWWVAWRNGRQALAAEFANAASLWSRTTDRFRTRSELAGYQSVQSPLSALIWQFARQHRAVLCAATTMLAIAAGSFGLCLAENIATVRWASPGLIILSLLAANWLGVLAFQGDNLQQRINFLADRGVSPRAIWITRHALPVSVLTLFMLSLVVIYVWTAGIDWRLLGENGLIIGLMLTLIALAYFSAQWTGQVIHSPILAAVAAPLVACAAISCAGFAVPALLRAPSWLWIVWGAIPAAATWTMMRRWVDRRFGWSYWFSHSAFLGLYLLLPAIPWCVVVVSEPAMPAQVARELADAAAQYRGRWGEPQELVLSCDKANSVEAFDINEYEDSGPGPIRAIQSLRDSQDAMLKSIGDQIAGWGGPVNAASFRVINYLQTLCVLSRMGTKPNPTGEASIARYRTAMGLLTEISKRLRISDRVIEQDLADHLEIWLLTEVKQPAVVEHLGIPLHRQIVQQIGDQSARQDARRRAVAISWARHQSSTQFGGYNVEPRQADVGMTSLVGERRLSMAIADLWTLANGGAEAATPALFQRIATFWGYAPAEYGIGPTGANLRADDLLCFTPSGVDLSSKLIIASQWFAGWEREAAELLGHMNEANTQGGSTDASGDATAGETNVVERVNEESNQD